MRSHNFGSSICIQLLLFQNNPNNVYLHSFPVTLEFLELSYRNSIKRNQKAHLIFTQKTPTLYQWTTQFCASTKTNVHYTLDGALKTLYSSAPSILSLSGNISSIHSESSNIANISQSQRIIITMILTSLVLFICLVYFAVWSFVFLTMHLPLMDAFSVKIEQLQRDII